MDFPIIKENNTMIVPREQILMPDEIISSGNFIEANTKQVILGHLQKETIIPVFAKDNETTISHGDFISSTQEVIDDIFPNSRQRSPNIRVSHVIKGRIPGAIGKAVKDLLPNEKTLYYERMAFLIELPEIKESVNQNALSLVIGGVRAYNQENLYAKKSMEKFKVFIGFKNRVCTNLCISTDGFKDEIKVSSIHELKQKLALLLSSFNASKQLGNMERLSNFHLSEEQFAHLLGKLKMYSFLSQEQKGQIAPIGFNDSQISSIVKSYHNHPNFGPDENRSLSLWNLYNLFTGATKSSYIDSFLRREVQAYEFTQTLANSMQNNTENWYLHN